MSSERIFFLKAEKEIKKEANSSTCATSHDPDTAPKEIKQEAKSPACAATHDPVTAPQVKELDWNQKVRTTQCVF